jgi:hypothetical protein
MLKFVTALSAALIGGWALVGSATTAKADYARPSYGHSGHGGHGGCCGPIKPSYSSKTVYKHKYINKHRDVWRHKHVTKIKRHYHLTRIQPIYHINTVTRVHTKIIAHVKPVYIHRVTYLPPKKIYTGSTVYLRPVCGCGGGGYGGYGGGGKGYRY